MATDYGNTIALLFILLDSWKQDEQVDLSGVMSHIAANTANAIVMLSKLIEQLGLELKKDSNNLTIPLSDVVMTSRDKWKAKSMEKLDYLFNSMKN